MLTHVSPDVNVLRKIHPHIFCQIQGSHFIREGVFKIFFAAFPNFISFLMIFGGILHPFLLKKKSV